MIVTNALVEEIHRPGWNAHVKRADDVDPRTIPPWARTTTGYEPAGPVSTICIALCRECSEPVTLLDAVEGRSALITLARIDPATRHPRVDRLCPTCTKAADRG